MMYFVNSVVYLIIGGAVGDAAVTLMRRRTIKSRR